MHISPLRTLLSWDEIRRIDDQTNILVLGIAGGEHEGPTLSDSILVTNYNFKKNRAVTIGIPRDVWAYTIQDKINAAYAIGEAKQRGGGLKLAKAEVSSIIGTPIQYGVVINFQEFKELIDYLDGIDVEVENSFVDNKYPIEGKENDECGGDPEYHCRYETVSFQRGTTHMDGSTALKFVRSRNAIGTEGSDFSRSKRQQKILIGVKDKTLSLVRSMNVQKIEELYKHLDPLITRDLTNQQAAIIAKEIVLKGNFQLKNYALPRDFFVVPNVSTYDGRYVLTPTNSDFRVIHEYVHCEFTADDGGSCKP